MTDTLKSKLDTVERKVLAGERLSREDAMALLACPDLNLLSALADWKRGQVTDQAIVTYNIGRNINYTNVCWVRCKFCAFYRTPGHDEGYVLPTEVILEKCRELVAAGGREVLLQGGLHPGLKIEWYEDLLRAMKAAYPVDIHGFSSTEINYIAHVSRLSLEETLRRLRDAGLDSIPGAAEMIVDDVRDAIAPYKEKSQRWVELMRTAHRLGIPTSATMMFGTVDDDAMRVEHLMLIRALQDETGGFKAFIPWSFQPDGTDLQAELGPDWQPATSFDYLKLVATARLVLDNIPHVQASWVTQGPRIAQIALKFGVDDFGSTMMEENVVSSAGTSFLMPISEIQRHIRDAGYRPQLRDTQYRYLPDPPAESVSRDPQLLQIGVPV
ncbi:MAG TPA: cyclic dehypoxanthinyl futalosine synthase [Armatimonadota bacterium]